MRPTKAVPGRTRNDVRLALVALETLEKTTKRSLKRETLEKNIHNDILQSIFFLTYDWRHTFGIRTEEGTDGVTLDSIPDVSLANWRDFVDLLGRFAGRKLTGGHASRALGKFLGKCSAIELKWYSRILNRDLRVGAKARTVNKVWDGLINEFVCQLAHKYLPGETIVEFPLWVEYKPDGYRTFYFVENGKAVCRGREGHDFPNLQFVADAFAQVSDDVVIDSETVVGDWNKTQSLLSTLPSNLKHKQEWELHHQLKVWCFDMIPLKDFRNRFCELPLRRRKKRLKHLVRKVRQSSGISGIRLMPHWATQDEETIGSIYRRVLDLGYEGVMLKNPGAPYDCERGTHWLKYKPVHSVEGIITGFREGSGKNIGKLGSFEVRVGRETAYVGGGFTDEDRLLFWGQRDRLLGRVIEFRLQADVTKVATARFPIFVRFRDDRTG